MPNACHVKIQNIILIKRTKFPANYISTTLNLLYLWLFFFVNALALFEFIFVISQPAHLLTLPVKLPTTTCSVAGPVIRSDRSDGYDGSIQCPASVGALYPLYLCVPPSILTPLRGVSILAPLYHLPPSGVSMPAISSNVTPPHMYFSFWAKLPSQQAI